MKLIDDRTTEQLKTHTILITATDRFMLGWGQAANGLSKCAWACKNSEHADKIMDWVESRQEMKHVNIHYNNSWRPRNVEHVQIYVVNEDHPAIR